MKRSAEEERIIRAIRRTRLLLNDRRNSKELPAFEIAMMRNWPLAVISYVPFWIPTMAVRR
jgi:hypothetical protein